MNCRSPCYLSIKNWGYIFFAHHEVHRDDISDYGELSLNNLILIQCSTTILYYTMLLPFISYLINSNYPSFNILHIYDLFTQDRSRLQCYIKQRSVDQSLTLILFLQFSSQHKLSLTTEGTKKLQLNKKILNTVYKKITYNFIQIIM